LKEKGMAKKNSKLQKLALEKGAYRARTFSARLVVVDERVRLKCQIPLCPHFGQTLTCPPNVPTVEEFSRALASYETALLVQTRSSITGDIGDAERDEVLKFFSAHGKHKEEEQKAGSASEDLQGMKLAAVQLHKLVNDVEGAAMAMGYPYALGLIGGECMLCPSCVGQGSGKACRRPFQARPSMEGVGVDVVKTAMHAGLSFDIPPKHEIVWSGLILIE